jgi:hypothetical protein
MSIESHEESMQKALRASVPYSKFSTTKAAIKFIRKNPIYLLLNQSSLSVCNLECLGFVAVGKRSNIVLKTD